MQPEMEMLKEREFAQIEQKFQEFERKGKGAKVLIVQLLGEESWEIVEVAQ